MKADQRPRKRNNIPILGGENDDPHSFTEITNSNIADLGQNTMKS